MSLNKTLLLGNLVRDPELRFGKSGTAYCKFTVACTTQWGTPEDRKEDTAFVDCTVFGKSAEKIGGLKKGAQVFVEGRLKLDTWEDKQTGQKRSKLSVMVESCRLAQPAEDASRPAPKPASEPKEESAPHEANEPEDVPF